KRIVLRSEYNNLEQGDIEDRGNGKLTLICFFEASPPTQPNRKDNLTVVEPGIIKRGKGGTLASRVALLQSLANIEQWAIDLSWDVIARFFTFRLSNGLYVYMFTSLISLEQRIMELASCFGALPVLKGDSIFVSFLFNLLARLAIVHMVHEAKCAPSHSVQTGLRWFTYICSKEERDSMKTFHELVKLHFKGFLNPPFNTEGRRMCCFFLNLVKSFPLSQIELISDVTSHRQTPPMIV
uniref:Uncharacterized protein n=1 Tax=Cyprinus carpio carpio TaxID=630221 RepID=A0A8C1BBR7_CYPCA